MVDYAVPDRRGEHIRLITTILDPGEATAEHTRRSSYRERRPSDKGIRHTGPPTVQLLTLTSPRPAR
ncbi:hypothetical protein [Planomonospora algeriensis]